MARTYKPETLIIHPQAFPHDSIKIFCNKKGLWKLVFICLRSIFFGQKYGSYPKGLGPITKMVYDQKFELTGVDGECYYADIHIDETSHLQAMYPYYTDYEIQKEIYAREKATKSQVDPVW